MGGRRRWRDVSVIVKVIAPSRSSPRMRRAVAHLVLERVGRPLARQQQPNTNSECRSRSDDEGKCRQAQNQLVHMNLRGGPAGFGRPATSGTEDRSATSCEPPPVCRTPPSAASPFTSRRHRAHAALAEESTYGNAARPSNNNRLKSSCDVRVLARRCRPPLLKTNLRFLNQPIILKRSIHDCPVRVHVCPHNRKWCSWETSVT
jgi:hypothetical protein